MSSRALLGFSEEEVGLAIVHHSNCMMGAGVTSEVTGWCLLPILALLVWLSTTTEFDRWLVFHSGVLKSGKRLMGLHPGPEILRACMSSITLALL